MQVSCVLVTYLNTWVSSVRPKHVASIEENNKFFFVVEGSKYVNI
jgi:hypothetical protein